MKNTELKNFIREYAEQMCLDSQTAEKLLQNILDRIKKEKTEEKT